MLRMTLKALLILVLLTAALIGLVRASPADDQALRKLIVPVCDSPCWQGIKTDVTTRQQATAMLQASPWVGQVFQTPIALSWHWSGRQPPLIDGTKDGFFQITGGVVTQIRIETLIPFGDVWLLLDRPDDARLAQPLTRMTALQIAAYETVGVEAMSTFDCPATPFTFWTATITLGMGKIWPVEALDSRNFNIYHAANWWRNLREC